MNGWPRLVVGLIVGVLGLGIIGCGGAEAEPQTVVAPGEAVPAEPVRNPYIDPDAEFVVINGADREESEENPFADDVATMQELQWPAETVTTQDQERTFGQVLQEGIDAIPALMNAPAWKVVGGIIVFVAVFSAFVGFCGAFGAGMWHETAKGPDKPATPPAPTK